MPDPITNTTAPRVTSNVDLASTLSKGLGACGGYLCGSRNLIEYQRYMLPGFVFSVGMSPPLAAAALESIRLIRRNPEIMANLRRNVDCFMAEAKRHGFQMGLAGKTAILPVLIGDDGDAAKLSIALRREGVFVPPAVYPAVPRGEARLRFSVSGRRCSSSDSGAASMRSASATRSVSS